MKNNSEYKKSQKNEILTIILCIQTYLIAMTYQLLHLKMLEAEPGFIINCVNVLWLKRFIY